GSSCSTPARTSASTANASPWADAVQAPIRSDPVDVAAAHVAGGRLQDAKAVLAEVLREQPRHVRALCALGAIALRGGEIARAFELAGHAVAAAPGDAMANGALAV